MRDRTKISSKTKVLLLYILVYSPLQLMIYSETAREHISINLEYINWTLAVITIIMYLIISTFPAWISVINYKLTKSVFFGAVIAFLFSYSNYIVALFLDNKFDEYQNEYLLFSLCLTIASLIIGLITMLIDKAKKRV